MYALFLQMTEEESRIIFNKMIESCTYDNFNKYMDELNKERFYDVLYSFFMAFFINEIIFGGNKND